jgi:thioredoxin 1
VVDRRFDRGVGCRALLRIVGGELTNRVDRVDSGAWVDRRNQLGPAALDMSERWGGVCGLTGLAVILSLTACSSGNGMSAASAPSATSSSTLAPVTLPALDPSRPIYDPTRNARQDIATALAASARDSKKVLIDLGADWCPDCQVLARTYRSSTVEPFLASHYHLVNVDVGQWDHNVDVADSYDHAIDNGIPALVVLDPSGKVLTTTADGSFENARNMSATQVLAFLQQWVGRS